MNIFSWLFGKKKSDKKDHPDNTNQVVKALPDKNQEKNTNDIKVYDKYGREFYITKEQWKTKVLLDNLEKVKNNPDELYNILLSALHDGFFEEAIKYSEILVEIDAQNSRGTIILGIAYMKCKRLDDAMRVFNNFIKTFGDDGIVLTNLAKVYAEKGNQLKAESILWHALEVDPNQENGLGWYAAIQNERGGELALLETYRRIATFPESWRAQLLLARFSLQKKDIETARKLYHESIENAGSPVPEDLLRQMSGDLGNNGYLKEIIELVEPHFQANLYGIRVGNNLIKTNFELAKLQEAKLILNQLYDLNHPDWREILAYWDIEIAKKGITTESKNMPKEESIALFSIEGPLWCRDNSPFAQLLPPKDPESAKIFIFGNTILQSETSQNIGAQLADAPGRASRFIPLFLAEQICLTTNAETHVLIPWIQTKGFAVFGNPNSEKELCELIEKNEVLTDFVFNVIVDVTSDIWAITVNIIRRIDRISLEKITVKCKPENIGPVVLELSKGVKKSLIRYTGVNEIAKPVWYTIPNDVSCSDYLLRLEQLITVVCMNQDYLEGGGIHGENEIMEGILFLNLRNPLNKTFRIVLAHALKQMKKYKPNVVNLFKEKILLLQKAHPLAGIEGELISKAIADIF